MRHMHAAAITAGLAIGGCGGDTGEPGAATVPREEAQAVTNGDLIFARGARRQHWRLLVAPGGEGHVALLSPRRFVGTPLPSPDGRRLAFAVPTRGREGSTHVSVGPTTSLRSRRLTRNRWATWPAGWSPDGRRLLVGRFNGMGRNAYLVVNVDGRGRRLLRAEGWVAESASWSPDGTRILVQVASLGWPGHYVIDTRTWQSTRLIAGDERLQWARFIPGGRLAFTSYRPRPLTFDLWLADEDGSNPELIASTRGRFWRIEPSPDGSRLAISVLFGDDDTSRLVVLPATARLQRITEVSGVPGRHPVWSPDGEKLASVRGRYPTDDLWIRSVDGSVERRLTRTRAMEIPLAWPAASQ
jgi:Tol biopolymer transport system component